MNNIINQATKIDNFISPSTDLIKAKVKKIVVKIIIPSYKSIKKKSPKFSLDM